MANIQHFLGKQVEVLNRILNVLEGSTEGASDDSEILQDLKIAEANLVEQREAFEKEESKVNKELVEIKEAMAVQSDVEAALEFDNKELKSKLSDTKKELTDLIKQLADRYEDPAQEEENG